MADNIIARNKIEIAIDGSGVDVGIAKIDKSIKGLSQSAINAGRDASKGINDIGSGGTKAAESIDKSTRNIISSIQRQTAAFTAGKRGTAEYYESIANLKGANLDALKPYIAQLKEAQNQADKLTSANKNITSSFGGLSIAKTLIAGVAASIASISFAGAIRGALDFADSISDVAKANEVAISSVLKLSSALQLNGGQSDNASKLFSSLTGKLDEAAEGSEKAQKQFKLVGVSLQDLKTLDGQALFEKTLQGLAAIEDPVKRNAVAMDIFGKAVKGVDIKGLAADFANNKENFTQAEQSFKDVAKSMDKLDEFTAKFKTTLATLAAAPLKNAITFTESYGSTVLKAIPIIGRMVDLMERYVKAQNALAGNSASGKIRPATGKEPVVREVIDANAEEVKKAREQANKDAAKAQQDAIKKAKDLRDKANAELLKDAQFQINFDQDLLEAKNQSEINAAKELQKIKDENYKKDIERVNKLQEIANDNFDKAQKELQKQEDERVKEFEKSIDAIDDVFRNGFANMVNGGKGTWKSFTQSLVTTFKTTVADAIYKMLAQPFVVKIVASILGATGSTVASATTSNLLGSSSSSSLTSAKGIFDLISSTNASIIGGIESVGANIANGLGGIRDSIGGFIGENASAIADGFAYAGALLQLAQGNYVGAAFTAIGTAIGGPIGGAIGGFIGSLFGGLGGTVDPSGNTTGTFKNGKRTSQSNFSGWGDPVTPGIVNGLASIQDAFAGTLTAILTAFNKNTDITLTGAARAGDIFQAYISGTVGGKSVGVSAWEGQTADLSSFATLVMGKGIADAIQNLDLSTSFKKLFAGLTDNAVITNMVNATFTLIKSQDNLAKSFGLTVDQSLQVANATGLVGDSLISFMTSLSTAAGSLSKAEILTSARGTLTSVIGQDLPSTLKAFDNLIKGIDKSNAAGINQVVSLLNVRAGFEQYTNAIDALKGGVTSSLLGVVSSSEKQAMLNADLEKAFNVLGITVPSSIGDLITLGKSIDFTSTSGLELASVFPSLVNAFITTKGAIDDLMNSLRDVNTFTTAVDFNRYKGIASNYGNSFANNYVDGLSSNVTASNSVNTPVNTSIVQASNNTSISTSDPNLLEAIKTLTVQVQALQASSDKTAAQSKRAADVLVNVSPNGNALQTEVYVP